MKSPLIYTRIERRMKMKNLIKRVEALEKANTSFEDAWVLIIGISERDFDTSETG